MCQLLETIRIENGTPINIKFHNQRFNLARKELFDAKCEIYLENVIRVPQDLKDDILKCRVIYSKEIESIYFEVYQIRPVHSLKIVTDNSIDYTYKYLDRRKLESLRELREGADDILIVKNGLVTDTSYANIVFRHHDHWLTPSTPLLKGTRRENYIQTGKITEEIITPEDLAIFSEARIINAMIRIEDSPIISIDNIYR